MNIEDYLNHESDPTAISPDADLMSRMSAPSRGNRRGMYRRSEDRERIEMLRKLAEEDGETIRERLDRNIRAAEKRRD